ncbi:MAG: sigma 54-interacting transcriptional regulator [Porticoccaceae bacterium]|nr:sigma 54-interacting transcriptional regulator [Porticoccaceae bacterium]
MSNTDKSLPESPPTKPGGTDSHSSELVRQELELILQAAGDGIYGIDCSGKGTFANRASSEILGWKEEEVIGHNVHALHHHSRPNGSPYPKEQCPIYAAFKDGLVHRGDDEIFWKADGTCIPVEYTSTPIYNSGKLSGAVVVFRDISERKRNEEALQAAHLELARMKERLEEENTYLQEEFSSKHNFEEIVGQSCAITQVLSQVELVAPTYANVMITGESGTGKELIARAIHERSDRNERPLIKVNCAAIPHELFESEFFGHQKGAFTGAIRDRVGRFELADGGTIFLDEVGEIPLDLQSKLLRVLQEGQLERVGESKTRNVDVRIIAATNRDLKAEIEEQRFREDLYFRLNVFPIEAVPLRKRADDIPLLAQHFITLISHKLNRPSPKLSLANVKQLQTYPWPGNIRELQNVIERAIIICQNNKLKFDLPTNASNNDLGTNSPNAPSSTSDKMPDKQVTSPTPGQNTHENRVAGDFSEQLPYSEDERLARDRENIRRALAACKGKISGNKGAAQLLGIKPTTLASRIKKLGMETA